MDSYPKKIIVLTTAFFLLCAFAVPEAVLAEGEGPLEWDTFEVMPYRSIKVKGDAAKFKAINWIDDGSTGGIKKMGFDVPLSEDRMFSFTGHAIGGDNNYGADINIRRENGGYLKMNAGNFRKWYDVYGGHFPNFQGTQAIQKLRVDPEMDIGNFFFEIGTNSNILENVPGISLSFQRRTKEGIKSSTQWGVVSSKKIAPAFQEESLTTDTITLKGNTDVSGFNVSGEQKVSFLDGRTKRVVWDDDAPPQDQSQVFEPHSKSLTSMLKADRWLVDDKSYVSLAYRFQHNRSDMEQTITTYNRNTGVIPGDSHDRHIKGKGASDIHSWVQHYFKSITPNLSFNAKLKQQIEATTGSGFAIHFTNANNDRAAEYEQKSTTIGESVSLRYNGLKRTSLYTDWDFEQNHLWFWRTRVGSSQTEVLDTGPRTTGVIGAQHYFGPKLDMTTNYRFRKVRDNFDTFFNDDNGVTLSRFNFTGHEFNTRLTWKPVKWLRNSVRVQLGDTVYRVRNLGNFTTSPDWVKSQANSYTFTYNTVLVPSNQWLFDLAYSLNNARVSTPATQFATVAGGIPAFKADVHTWIMTASYAPKPDFSVFSSAYYSLAKNYDDKSFSGIPYGVDNEHYDVSLGFEWTPKENITVKPRYAYYSYRTDPSIDFSNYSAHAGWVECSFDW